MSTATKRPEAPPEEEEGRPEAPRVPCGEKGGIKLDLSALPFPPGTVLVHFTFGEVDFVRIWDTIQFGETLMCNGSEQDSAGVWHDATVRLYFCTLPCLVYEIVAEVDGHGPEATLTGYLSDGTHQSAVCPGDRRSLHLAASRENPFVSAELSGQEAEWFSVFLG